MTQTNNDKNKLEGVSRIKSKQNPWKRVFAKRWTYPAVYLGAAALIIGLMYVKTHQATPTPTQNHGTGTGSTQQSTQAPSTSQDQATASGQSMIWPIGPDGNAVVVTQNFYSDTATDAYKAASLVKYGNEFYPQDGIVMGLMSDNPFTVVAAASGTVTAVNQDPLMGMTVTIKDSADSNTTYYASLQDIMVKVGDKITQGQDIAKSSNNEFEANQKNHLHFEIRDSNGKFLNPVQYLPVREGSAASVPDSSSVSSSDTSSDTNTSSPSTSTSAGSSAKTDIGSAAQSSASGTSATTPAAGSENTTDTSHTNATVSSSVVQ